MVVGAERTLRKQGVTKKGQKFSLQDDGSVLKLEYNDGCNISTKIQGVVILTCE